MHLKYFVLTVLVSFFTLGFVFSQEPLCDSSLLKMAKRDLLLHPYRQRDYVRCEGVYSQNRSPDDSGLTLGSFLYAFEDYEINNDLSILKVEWGSNPYELPIRLQAQDQVEGIGYRMDALLDIGESYYDWPTDIISEIPLTRADLLVRGWLETNIEGFQRELNLPLTISLPESEIENSQYIVLLKTTDSLTNVRYSLSKVEKPLKEVFPEQETSKLAFNKGDLISISLPKENLLEGVYRLDVSAKDYVTDTLFKEKYYLYINE